MIERFDGSLHNADGGISDETPSADAIFQVSAQTLTVFKDGTMTSKVRPEIRRIGLKQFPRWVIIDDGTKMPSQRKFWNGEVWVEGLRSAMFFAHKNAVLAELERAKGE
jgi:hypothetical protein